MNTPGQNVANLAYEQMLLIKAETDQRAVLLGQFGTQLRAIQKRVTEFSEEINRMVDANGAASVQISAAVAQLEADIQKFVELKDQLSGPAVRQMAAVEMPAELAETSVPKPILILA